MKLLRLRYSYEMVSAYLAQMMGDTQSMNSHLDAAQALKGKIVLCELNLRVGLFD